MKYAAETTVPAERSRSEIERTLQRYGATAFMYGWQELRAVISFELQARRYRIVLQMPARADPAFARTPAGRSRTQAAAQVAYEQAMRQRWRALALWIMAVLEAAETGIVTLTEVLQPFTVLPDGSTAGDWLAPQLAAAYRSGLMPALLPLGLPGPRGDAP